ncbi:MAG: hypothetical protein M3406_13240 [Chloroflexota bacterium]|nr:hypothetical protein [Chloroflexota bacterium]
MDSAQAFLFGSYRVHRADGRLLQEGLIHADDLGDVDLSVLAGYCDSHAADNRGRLRLVSRSQFAEWLIWKVGYEARALIVGFNLPFDFSRIALGWRAARNGGFTLRLYESVDGEGRIWTHKWRPELTVKALDSKRQLVNFTTPQRLDPENRIDGRGYRGRFLDLRTLAYALSDRSHTLNSAAAAWGLETLKLEIEELGVVSLEAIDYNRQDTRLTHLLYRAMTDDWAMHPVDLDPEQAFSPAAVSKAYLRKMGISPPLERLR